ncbi:MAG: hypothetical protein AAGH92_04500 [Planctomycetota bacterium]
MVATLSLFLVVPVVVFVAWQLIEADFADVETPPLVWSERATWAAYDVKPKPLEHGVMSKARTGKTYKDYGFRPDQALLESIARCRAIAESEAFSDAESFDKLIDEVRIDVGNFYAAALIALWFDCQGPGKASEASLWWERAIEMAPAALVQPVSDREGDALPGFDVGKVAFAFDTVEPEMDVLSTQLVLTFPGVRTGADGVWYLPIFKTIFRVIDPALGPPVPNDPMQSVWLTHVGNVGRLPTLTQP